jgi:site-specific DNA-methyltransferase (adenine-specific)
MNQVKIGKATLMQCDCMEFMATLPDKYFDLAIIDPPYGINAANSFSGKKRKSGNGSAMKTAFAKKDWDISIPPPEYFAELYRVSVNRIIWGANYITEFLPPSMGWIVWDKDNGTTKFSDCELAFSSFNSALRMYKYTWNGMLQGDMKNKDVRIHPTQKPIKLYEWLLTNYAKSGDKILDTHGGSFSSAIACNNLGFEFHGCELDTDYFNEAVKRVTKANNQERLFA